MTSKVWEFKDPDTGYIYKANNEKELLERIVNYRKQNELSEIEFLPVVVENCLCRRRVNLGACEAREPLKRSIQQYFKGGIALLKSMVYKSYTSQREADRRAKICTLCPLNIFPDKGPFLKWADETAELMVGSRKSMHHSELGNCAACGCNLRAKVFFDGTIELTDKEFKEMPEQCWQKQEVLKHRFIK